MKKEHRLILAFVLAPLLLALLIAVYRIVFEIGIEVLNSGLYNISIFLLLHIVLVLPLSIVLMLIHFGFSTYNIYAWWLVSVATGTVFATFMWPMLGLNLFVPIIGIIGGLLFHLLAMFPQSKEGNKISDPLILIRSLCYISLFLALFYIPIKLSVVEVNVNQGTYFGLAFKDTLSLTSYIDLQHPKDMSFILLSKENYLGQKYFKMISTAGWLIMPVLFLVSFALLILNRKKTE